MIRKVIHASTEKRLLDQVRDRMRLKNYTYRTEKSYLYWIKLLPNKTFGSMGPALPSVESINSSRTAEPVPMTQTFLMK